MHMPPPSAEDTARAVELGHEPSTISVKGVAWSIGIFFVFGALVHVAIYVMYHQMLDNLASQDPERSALNSVKVYPPEPRLQPTRIYHERTEPEDLALMHGQENLEFVRRNWINESGVFHVPDDVIAGVSQQATSTAGSKPVGSTATEGVRPATGTQH